jgi:hypothetical protein
MFDRLSTSVGFVSEHLVSVLCYDDTFNISDSAISACTSFKCLPYYGRDCGLHMSSFCTCLH